MANVSAQVTLAREDKLEMKMQHVLNVLFKLAQKFPSTWLGAGPFEWASAL